MDAPYLGVPRSHFLYQCPKLKKSSSHMHPEPGTLVLINLDITFQHEYAVEHYINSNYFAL
jgi:hypothetical protein